MSVVAMADKLRIVRGWIKGYAAHSAQLVTTTFDFSNQTVFVVGSPVGAGDGRHRRRGWWCGRHRKLTGYGDIVHCSYYIEHKAGHLVKVAARIQSRKSANRLMK